MLVGGTEDELIVGLEGGKIGSSERGCKRQRILKDDRPVAAFVVGRNA